MHHRKKVFYFDWLEEKIIVCANALYNGGLLSFTLLGEIFVELLEIFI